MKTKNTLAIVLILSISTAVLQQSCNSENGEAKTESQDSVETPNKVDITRFPNDRSELALLMRKLYDDLKANRKLISEGGKSEIDWSEEFKSMPYATPTENKNSGPVFTSFANKYLLDLRSFQNAPDSSHISTYNSMIQSCLDCHAEYCRGPMETIGKLKI